MRSRALATAIAALAAIACLWLQPADAQVQPAQVYKPPPPSQGRVRRDNVSASSTYQQPGFNAQWSTLLGNALYYYDIQRAGTLPDDFRVDWRRDSVPNDGQDVGLDLSGGFFDAGNYVKATFPLCWVVTQISWGALMFGSGYDGANQTPYLDGMLRVALNWLLEASSKPDELVVFIGTQHFYWGPETGIPPDERPSFVVSRDKPGTDAFASCSSAFASAAMLYEGTPLPINTTTGGSAASLRDTGFAATLRSRAESLFELARTAEPQQVYQKATDGVEWAYPSTDYADDLVLSSTWLALLTANRTYADYALQTYTDSYFPYSNGALNWDQHTPATSVLLSQLAIAQPSFGVDLAEMKANSELWLDNIVNRRMRNTYSTPAGLFWFKGDSDPASLNPISNAVALMLTYSSLASSAGKAQSYRDFAQGQIDYILGKNPMNAVYPVGTHPNSPQNPHSALAAGGTDRNRIDSVPENELHVLYGGVVGGPGSDDNFYDARRNYTQTEVAMSSNSPILTICAYFWQRESEMQRPIHSTSV